MRDVMSDSDVNYCSWSAFVWQRSYNANYASAPSCII